MAVEQSFGLRHLLPDRIPRLIPLRGQWWVRPHSESPVTLRLGVGWYEVYGGKITRVAPDAAATLDVVCYPNEPVDLCAIWRRILFAREDWANPFVQGGASPHPSLMGLLSWPLSFSYSFESSTEFGQNAKELIGTLGYADAARAGDNDSQHGFFLTNRPAPLRVLPRRQTLLSIYYGCHLPDAMEVHRYDTSCERWVGRGWARIDSAPERPLELLEKKPDGGQGELAPMPLGVTLGGNTLRLQSAHGELRHQASTDCLALLHGRSRRNIISNLTLVRYLPAGPPDGVMLLYWINARGGWETSVLEWCSWTGGREAPDDPVAQRLGRAHASQPPRRTWEMPAVQASLSARIFAPARAERYWLGELQAAPLAYISAEEGRYVQVWPTHPEQLLGGGPEASPWVEVQLRVGLPNGMPPPLIGPHVRYNADDPRY